MIVSLEEVSEILKGELEELHLPDERPPEKGSVQAIQSAVGRRAACSVRILDAWPHRSGGHIVRFELAAKQVPPRLLRPKGGYASDARGAMRDSTVPTSPPAAGAPTGVPHPLLGGPAEPEAVDVETLKGFAEEARTTSRQAMVARRLEYEAVPIVDRLETLIAEAERLGLDAGREIARLEAGLAKFERRIKREQQQRRAA